MSEDRIKMADVFNLPIEVDDCGDVRDSSAHTQHNNNGLLYTSKDGREDLIVMDKDQLVAMCQAVNSHDRLTERIAQLEAGFGPTVNMPFYCGTDPRLTEQNKQMRKLLKEIIPFVGYPCNSSEECIAKIESLLSSLKDGE